MVIPKVELIRSKKRKTISLQVKAGQVRVLAPFSVSKQYIDDLIIQKSSWLQQKISQQQQHLTLRQQQPQLQAGEDILYLGESYTLVLKQAKRSAIFIQDKQIVVCCLQAPEELSIAQLKELLEHWYIEQANNLLPERLTYLQQQTGLQASALKIRHYKTRWGSCDAKHRINLNWLLIMTPIDVIDYVITHELCHIVHLNHSAAYWQLVAQHSPNYKQAKQWLNDHQHKLQR